MSPGSDQVWDGYIWSSQRTRRTDAAHLRREREDKNIQCQRYQKTKREHIQRFETEHQIVCHHNFSQNISRMNLQLVAVIFVVLVAGQLSDAHGGGGPKKDKNEARRPPLAAPVPQTEDHESMERGGRSSEERPEHPAPTVPGDRYIWNRVLSENVTAHESAFVPSNGSVVVAISVDRVLRQLNISGAISAINSTNTSQIEVIQVKDICYLKDPSLNYQEYVDLIVVRNNTNVTVANSISLNATGPHLTEAEVRILFNENPVVAKLCHKRKVIQTSLDVVPSPDTQVKVVLTPYAQLHLYVSPPPPPPTPKGLLGVLRGGPGKGDNRRGH